MKNETLKEKRARKEHEEVLKVVREFLDSKHSPEVTLEKLLEQDVEKELAASLSS